MEYCYNFDNSIKVGPSGYEFGNKEWIFKPNEGIKEITVSYGAVIDSLSFNTIDQNGKITSSDKFGGSGGARATKITINWPKEYLVKISGSLGSHDDIRCIASLHFYTNLATYGPFGSSTCGSCGFEFCMKDGAIVGFYGNHGVYLNAIGVFLKSTAALFIPGIQYLLPEPVRDEPRDVELITIYQDDPQFDMSGKFGPTGGDTGKPWDDGRFALIKHIDVYVQRGIVQGIQIQYQTNNCMVVESKVHGNGEGATIVYRVKLDSDEYLTEIMGFSGAIDGNSSVHIVRSLSLYTNKGRYGPFGNEIVVFFSYFKGKIVGFHGRSGHFLDAIGVYYD